MAAAMRGDTAAAICAPVGGNGAGSPAALASAARFTAHRSTARAPTAPLAPSRYAIRTTPAALLTALNPHPACATMSTPIAAASDALSACRKKTPLPVGLGTI